MTKAAKANDRGNNNISNHMNNTYSINYNNSDSN